MNDKGEACFPEGTDAGTCGYHALEFSFGNQFLLLPWEGNGATFREDSYLDFKSAPASIYMGLAVDTSEYTTMMSALSALKDEYQPQLMSGLFSESLYNEYLEKMKSSGIDEYVGLYQTAVSEFIS